MAADRGGRPAKPSANGLGVDLAALEWHRSGTAEGGLEVAFVTAPAAPAAVGEPEQPVEWVLVRVAGDPGRRVLVYDRVEWLNFLDGASKGEFDQAAGLLRLAEILLLAESTRAPRYCGSPRDPNCADDLGSTDSVVRESAYITIEDMLCESQLCEVRVPATVRK